MIVCKKNPLKQQRGAVLVLTALCLFVLLGMMALAIDLSHAYVNKTRLQNLADSLALSAAISLTKGESSLSAETYATTNTYPQFRDSPGNKEIQDEDANLTITYSFAVNHPGPYEAASATDFSRRFARVEISNMNVSTWFAGAIGFEDVAVASSAVAGSTPIVPCDLSPIMMCAEVNADADEDDGDGVFDHIDQDCTDGDCYGYNIDDLYCMSGATGSDPNHQCEASDNELYGAGNVGLLDFGKAFGLPSGASTIKECLAGSPDCKNFCSLPTEDIDGDGEEETIVPSKPGVSAGGVIPGIGTLFNTDHPSTGYPSDKITGLGMNPDTSDTYLDYGEIIANATLVSKLVDGIKIPTSGISSTDLSDAGIPHPYTEYQNFQGQTDNHASSNAEKDIRILGVPFIDCTDFENGKDADLPVVGYGCFFLSADITKNASEFFLLGSFTGDDACQGTGTPSSTNDFGFKKVQLYKDPFGGHS